MQSRKLSIIEAVTNTFIGLLMSFTIQLSLYPMLGIPVSLNQNVIITLVFFISSFLRGYFLRRFFNQFKN